MSYIGWVFIAMLTYGIMAVLLKISLRNIPPEVAVLVTNVILVISALAWALFRGIKILNHLTFNQPTLFLLLAGIVLSCSVISFYMALSRGPVTAVLPIFGMNVAVASVLGFLVLGEPVNASRISGIILAGGAVFLLTR